MGPADHGRGPWFMLLKNFRASSNAIRQAGLPDTRLVPASIAGAFLEALAEPHPTAEPTLCPGSAELGATTSDTEANGRQGLPFSRASEEL